MGVSPANEIDSEERGYAKCEECQARRFVSVSQLECFRFTNCVRQEQPEHREQISSMLSSLGITPPDLDGWTYGEVTNTLVPIK